jgi:hypothetical protein
VVAELRELGECYLDFYCPPPKRREPFPSASPPPWLGWAGTAPGTAANYGQSTFRTGESKVWRDGEWVNPDDDTN